MLSCGINFSNDKIRTRFVNHLDLFRRCDKVTQVVADNSEGTNLVNRDGDGENGDSDSYDTDQASSIHSGELLQEVTDPGYVSDVVEDYYNRRIDEFIEVIKDQ